MIWSLWLCGVSFVISLSIAVLSFFAPRWLTKYRKEMAEVSTTISYHTWILVKIVVPSLRPTLYLSLLSLVVGIAAYLSTTDSNLMILIIVFLALFCLGCLSLKISDLFNLQRSRDPEPDHELGGMPSRPPPPPSPRRHTRPNHNDDTNSDDPSDHGGEWPSGGNPSHLQGRVNHLQTPSSSVNLNDVWGGHWDALHLELDARSLDTLVLFVSEQHGKLQDINQVLRHLCCRLS